MKTLHAKRNTGFTIIELMIVLIIVAILLALAYPSYTKYVRKANRGEAQQLLLNWSINQEIWRSNNTEYADGDDIAVPTNDHFTFSVTLPVGQESTAYILTADATGDQENDESRDGTQSCDIINLRSDGRKYNGNDPTKILCWE